MAEDNSNVAWRPPDNSPWCWQPKAVLKRIREALDADNTVSTGLPVYVVLTEIANDKRAATFQTTHAYIASQSGLSQRTVQKRIKDLAEIGVLRCVVPNLKSPATYTLILPDTHPLPNEVQSMPSAEKQVRDVEQPLPNDMQRSKNAPLPKYQEVIRTPLLDSKNKTKKPIKGFVSMNEAKMTAKASRTVELMEQCREVLGDAEMKRYHDRWYKRAETEPVKLELTLAHTKSEATQGRINATPAKFAEDDFSRRLVEAN